MRRLSILIAVLACGSGASAQTMVSAMAGYVHHVEGEVLIEGKRIQPKPEDFLHVQDGQALTTREGRVELMLTPGSFLRLGPSSEFEMIDAGLLSARMRLHSGNAVLELYSVDDGENLVLEAGDSEIKFTSGGSYRIDADGDHAVVKINRGQAKVSSQELKPRKLGAGRSLTLPMDLAAKAVKFNRSDPDPLTDWSKVRQTKLLAMARASARTKAAPSDYGSRAILELMLHRQQIESSAARMPRNRQPEGACCSNRGAGSQVSN